MSEQGGEMECEESGVVARAEIEDDSSAGKMKNSKQASIPSVTCSETPPLSEVQIIESCVAHDKTSYAIEGGNHIFGRITETAAKYFPKKSNFGKIFGDKEADIKISTIDREMAKHPPKLRSNHHYAPEFSNSELTDRLRRTKLPNADENISRCKSVGCLAIDYPPHRLYFLPCEDWRDPDSVINTLVRIILSQVALIIFLLLWIVFGALLFYLIEGPYEYNAALESEREEKSLALSLATDLRLVNPEEISWKETIDKYTALHRQVIIKAVLSSYGKQKFFWTYAGSLLFATSLLTTCGISTPLPMTGGGKIGAFIFTILGVPMHLMLLTNLGRTVALKVQILAKDVEIKFYELRRRISNVRKFGEDLGRDKDKWPEKIFIEEFKPPEWLCHLPILIIFLYYLFGCIIFGSFEDFFSFCLFPITFSSTNYHSTDLARFGYACYLEGLAVLISVNIALWRDSPYEGFASIGTSLRFMTNSVE